MFQCFYLAESQGFEPWRRSSRLHDFQSCAFDHSANSPFNFLLSQKARYIIPCKMCSVKYFLLFFYISIRHDMKATRDQLLLMFISKLGRGVFFSLQQIQQLACRLRLFRRDAECSLAFGVLGDNIRYDAADILRDLPFGVLPFIRIYQQIAGIVAHRHGCPI